MEKVDIHSKIVKSNLTIGRNTDFTATEWQLFYYCLAHYDSNHTDNPKFTARVSDLQEIFPINKKSAYQILKAAVIGINKKPVEFSLDGKDILLNWFQGFSYHTGTGAFEFMISPLAEPFFLGLKEKFTMIDIKDVANFKRSASYALYEPLKMRWKTKKWRVTVDELKLMLGVAGRYPKWSDFKKWILDKAKEEINTHSDLSVKYKTVKAGRKIDTIIFFIKKKTGANDTALKQDEPEVPAANQIEKASNMPAVAPNELEKTGGVAAGPVVSDTPETSEVLEDAPPPEPDQAKEKKPNFLYEIERALSESGVDAKRLPKFHWRKFGKKK